MLSGKILPSSHNPTVEPDSLQALLFPTWLLLFFSFFNFLQTKWNPEPVSSLSSTTLRPPPLDPPPPHHQHWLRWFSEPPFTWVSAWEDVLPQNKSSRHLEVKCPSRQSGMTFWKRAFIEPQIDESLSFKQGKVFYSSCFNWDWAHSFHFLCSPVLFRNDLFIPTQLKKYR